MSILILYFHRICKGEMYGFFKMLIDRKMKKKDICEQAGIATSTMAKMAKDENVSLDVLARICRALDCTMDDILDVLPAENEK